jgi:hypothetical protein
MGGTDSPSSARRQPRLLVGFLLLPVVDTIAAFWIHRLVWPDGLDALSRWGDPVDAATSFAAGVAIIAVVMTFAGAVPAVSWLAGRNRVSFKSLMIASVVLGNTPYAIAAIGTALFYVLGIAMVSDLRYVFLDGPVGVFRAVGIGSTVGALSGFVFWVIAMAGSTSNKQVADTIGL